MKKEDIFPLARLTLLFFIVPFVVGYTRFLPTILIYVVWSALPIVEAFARKDLYIWRIGVSILSILWPIYTLIIGFQNKAGSLSSFDWLILWMPLVVIYLTPILEWFHRKYLVKQ